MQNKKVKKIILKKLPVKPLTLADLGNFTEKVLLPAVERIIDDKMDLRFGKFEKRMDDKMDLRFGEFGKKMNVKFDKIDRRFDDIELKLSWFRSELESAKRDLVWIKMQIENIKKAGSEDIVAVNGDMESLKIRVEKLEKELAILRTKK